jgi:hypothetical protein
MFVCVLVLFQSSYICMFNAYVLQKNMVSLTLRSHTVFFVLEDQH